MNTDASDNMQLEILQAEAGVKLLRSMPELEFAMAGRNHEVVAALAQDMMSKLAIIQVAADFFKRKAGEENGKREQESRSRSDVAATPEHTR